MVSDERAFKVARYLIGCGVPVFLAEPVLSGGQWDPTAGVKGYRLPAGWQRTEPDPTVLELWRPGVALAAVMGHVVDGADIDPRNGGSATLSGLRAAGMWPRSYGHAETPSGGSHDLIAALGVGSRDGVRPGLDVKGGRSDGEGRGFLFIAPTVALSKSTGELSAYRWLVEPDLDELVVEGLADESGEDLAELVRPSREAPSPAATADPFTPPDRAGTNPHEGPIPAGQRDAVLRDYVWLMAHKGHGQRELEALVRARWEDCEQPAGKVYPLEQALAMIPRALSKAGPVEGGPLVEDDDERERSMVADEVRKLRVRDRARAEYAAEQAGEGQPFDAGSLAEVLARPGDPAPRIEGLLPWEGSLLLTAQRKAGKTTMTLNLAASLLTGEPFLDRFEVRPLEGRVALLNYEVSAAQVARWALEHGVDTERLFLVNLRGRRNPLGDGGDRARLAGLLRSQDVETVICDPFGRAYTGTSQNDAGEVTQFLTGLDTFARAEAGARDLVLTAHAGWNGERTRGSTALEDWADSIVTLVKHDDEAGEGLRYFRALGRDVDVEEDELHFDPDTRRLSLTGNGSRTQASKGVRVAKLTTSVLSVVLAHPGVSGSQVGARLKEAGIAFRNGEERVALKELVADGRITAKPGARNATLYTASTG